MGKKYTHCKIERDLTATVFVSCLQKTSRTSGTLSFVPPSPSPTPSSGVPHSARSHSKSSVSSTEGVVTTPPSSTYLDTPTTTAQQDTPINDSAFDEEGGRVTSNPAMEIVHLHIKSITQCIQDLLQAAQAHRQTRLTENLC